MRKEIKSSPAIRAKELGCETLNQVSRDSGVSLMTLRNWHKNKPRLFDLVCDSVAQSMIGSGDREAVVELLNNEIRILSKSVMQCEHCSADITRDPQDKLYSTGIRVGE